MGHLRMILERDQSHSVHAMAKTASQTLRNRSVNAIVHKLRELQSKNKFQADHVIIEGRVYPAELVSGYIILSLPDGTKTPMHHFVWRSEYGDIPCGYHIHHRNGNRIDNRLVNLTLMSAEDHIAHHASGRPAETEILFWFLHEQNLWDQYLTYRDQLIERVQKNL